MKKIKKILINILFFLLNFLIAVKKILMAIFANIFYLPLKLILKFFLHNVLAPIYKIYLKIIKKTGWKNFFDKKDFFNFVFKKNVIHVFALIIFAIVIYGNLTAKDGVYSSEELIGKTVLAKLVSNEFGEFKELIEEQQPEVSPITYLAYTNKNKTLSNSSIINTKEIADQEDEESLAMESGTLLRKSGISTIKNIPPRETNITYTVQKGDTISTLAKKFNISIETILWENNLSYSSFIKPGDRLTILPSSGVTYKIAKGDSLGKIASLYDVKGEDILKANNLSNPNQIKIGHIIIIPNGKKIKTKTITYIAKETTASEDTREKTAQKTIKQRSSAPVIGGKMNWPTSGHRVTQYYSWRHNGLDVANAIGTPIYAADSGYIETVGWNRGGYGNQIVINHGNGKKTRYAHLSRFAVSVGEKVSKGEYIAAMGSTGRSTGPHLHFEVMINGARYNPLNYIKY